MFKADDIHPISDFVRNYKRHHSRLRDSGRPEILTINGQPELVAVDVRAYERQAEQAERLAQENDSLRDRLEELETLLALDEAFAELERGEGRPAEVVLPALRARLGFARVAR